MFFARMRSASEATAAGCFLRECEATAATDVGHEGVIT